jgi:hypothetical protein
MANDRLSLGPPCGEALLQSHNFEVRGTPQKNGQRKLDWRFRRSSGRLGVKIPNLAARCGVRSSRYAGLASNIIMVIERPRPSNLWPFPGAAARISAADARATSDRDAHGRSPSGPTIFADSAGSSHVKVSLANSRKSGGLFASFSLVGCRAGAVDTMPNTSALVNAEGLI